MKKCILSILLGAIIMFTGCEGAVEENSENTDIYSREYVNDICSDDNFGKGKTGDIDIALEYIYSNENIKEEYGETFEAEYVGGSADTGITFIPNIYSGKGKYTFKICEDEWIIEVEKKLTERWEVSKAYKSIAEE